jgi:hypothetical protein
MAKLNKIRLLRNIGEGSESSEGYLEYPLINRTRNFEIFICLSENRMENSSKLLLTRQYLV